MDENLLDFFKIFQKNLRNQMVTHIFTKPNSYLYKEEWKLVEMYFRQ